MASKMYFMKSHTMWTSERTFLDLDCWDNSSHCGKAKQLVGKLEQETNGQIRWRKEEEDIELGFVENCAGNVAIDGKSGEKCQSYAMVDKENEQPHNNIFIPVAEKPKHMCQVCQKEFPCNGHLVRHQRIHTGDKPFQCQVCEKKFTWKHDLTGHMRYHTGEKPFNCGACEKSFAMASDLKRHQRLHTGERPYSCSFCGANFIQRAHLKVHERVHTGQKPYDCLICGKSFARKTYLNKHSRVHFDI